MIRSNMAVLLALVLVGACDETNEPTAPVAVAYAKTQVVPDGTGGGLLTDRDPSRTRNRVEYHNGQVMVGTSNVYIIWYGNWPAIDSAAIPIVRDFIISVGGSSYFRTVTHYSD